MAKYTAEEKLQAALRYLEGKESSHEIAKSIGTDHKTILIGLNNMSITEAPNEKWVTDITECKLFGEKRDCRKNFNS